MFWIAASAPRHGIAEDDMLHAVAHPIRIHEVEDGLARFVGPALDARLLEIGVVIGDQDRVIVHAMPARPRFL